MTTVTVNRKTRDQVVAALEAELDFEYGGVEVRRRRNGLTVTWTGAPVEAEVEKICHRIAGGVDLRLNRIRVWSCGVPHRDANDAWKYHNLRVGDHVTTLDNDCEVVLAEDLAKLEWPDTEAAVEVRELVGEIWADRFSDYTVEGVLIRDLEKFAERHGLAGSCSDGEYRVCPNCGGSGTYLDYNTRRFDKCGICEGVKVFDQTQPGQVAAYKQAVELWRGSAL